MKGIYADIFPVVDGPGRAGFGIRITWPVISGSGLNLRQVSGARHGQYCQYYDDECADVDMDRTSDQNAGLRIQRSRVRIPGAPVGGG